MGGYRRNAWVVIAEIRNQSPFRICDATLVVAVARDAGTVQTFVAGRLQFLYFSMSGYCAAEVSDMHIREWLLLAWTSRLQVCDEAKVQCGVLADEDSEQHQA